MKAVSGVLQKSSAHLDEGWECTASEGGGRGTTEVDGEAIAARATARAGNEPAIGEDLTKGGKERVESCGEERTAEGVRREEAVEGISAAMEREQI